MEKINEILSIIENNLKKSEFRRLIISSPIKKTNKDFKIVLETKENKGSIFYQFSYYYETKVRHENVNEASEISSKIEKLLLEGYKQWDVFNTENSMKILVNKKYNYKIMESNIKNENIKIKGHDYKKNYILKEGEPLEWLITLGIMNKDGDILKEKQKKFRQINRFLEMVEDVADNLPKDPVIVDFGCGKSYLTFALYYYLSKRGLNPNIIGLDLKEDVVSNCRDLAKKMDFDNLNFHVGDIKDFKLENKKINMIITLHACDVATDYALYNGILWGCEIIMSVPCCQHQLYNQVSNLEMKPILKHGILKERFSAILTDALRANMLEVFGYKTQVIEFIDMEHTPKNIMIRAEKQKENEINRKKLEEFALLKDMYGVEPEIWQLCRELVK